MKREKVILGIDPGTNIMGYGLIKISGKQAELLQWDVRKFHKLPDHQTKLKHIFEGTLSLIEQFLPDEMAVEAPFFGKNVQSMLKLGRAQGVIMAAAMYRNIPIVEYSPRKIKQSITGKGSAAKEQVAAMIEKTFRLKLDAKYLDATDGLAVALCHHYQTSQVQVAGGGKSWKKFIADNPDRLSD